MQPSPGSRATSPNKTGGAASGPMNEEEKRFFDKYGVLPPRSRPNKPYPHGDSTGYQEPTSAALKSFIAQQKAKRRSLLLQALVLLYHDRKRQPPSTALISTLPSDLLVRCIILVRTHARRNTYSPSSSLELNSVALERSSRQCPPSCGITSQKSRLACVSGVRSR